VLRAGRFDLLVAADRPLDQAAADFLARLEASMSSSPP
jgi:hypothetical protein